METDILRYKVIKFDKNPMYGKDKVMQTFDCENDAVKYAKSISRGNDEIGVTKVVYTCRYNLERDFAFNSYVIWGEWF